MRSCPNFGSSTSNTWLGVHPSGSQSPTEGDPPAALSHHVVGSQSLKLIPMNPRTANTFVRWGRTVKNAISFVSASTCPQRCQMSVSQNWHNRIPHPTMIMDVWGDFYRRVLIVRPLFQWHFHSLVIRSCNRGNAQLPSVSGIQAIVLYPCPNVTGFAPDKG